MGKFKPIDHKLLFELMKDAKRSDRQVAKLLGVSQPTITRRRAFLERELIDGYTTIPKWEKLGFEIFAITFVKSRLPFASKEQKEAAVKKGQKWVTEQPCVILASGGRGCRFDGVMLSFHKSYADYRRFITKLNSQMSDTIAESESFLVALRSDKIVKPFHLKYLAEVG